jgi:5-methylcytosine-specific restriction enzyme subunit McrC
VSSVYMKLTDIYLSNSTEKIIVDTKYYRETMQERFGKRSIHSDNLYQLFSYLKNVEARGAEYQSTKGVLLYPTVGSELDVRVFVQGHEVRAVTLNLNQPWQKVRQDILATFQ